MSRWLPRLKGLGVVALLGIAAIVAPAVRADDAVVEPRGTGVVPLRSDDVEMVAERVDVYLYQNWAYVEAVFTLRNTGPAAELLVGFPEEHSPEGDRPGNLAEPRIRDFTAQVDGSPLPVAYRPGLASAALPGLEIAGWHTFVVPFAAGQTRTVKHTYLLRSTRYSNDVTHFGYLLRTGALWKGPIGRADVLVHASGGLRAGDLELLRGAYGPATSPRPSRDHVVEGGVVAWHLDNLEPGPDDDVLVAVSPPADRPIVQISPARARPGEKVRYTVTARGPQEPWPAGSRVVLYAGQERRRVAESVLASPDIQAFGEFVLPAGLTPTRGRAAEVWAEHEPSGARAPSTLIYVEGAPERLPAAGGLPADTLAVPVGLAALCLVAIGATALLKIETGKASRGL